MTDFETVIGLEVHAQLSTNSKIFATSSTKVGQEPNTLTDSITLGLPGSLPVLNKKVVDFAIKLGLALNCKIEPISIFARKHYFYPDLPKGYQISQYDKPICTGGAVPIRGAGKEETKSIRLNRIHLEEDAGKSSHSENSNSSVVDLNRAGVPLVEIVSEADIRSAKEASFYMKSLRRILRYLDICDGNMEEGSLRCDANVSIRARGSEKFGTKVEIKNLNSFRYVEKAIEYEVERQTELVKQGKAIAQETRLWDDAAGKTRSMRSKEEAQDYRYFPDPDLLPLHVDEDWIENIRESLPELPDDVKKRFSSTYKLDDYLADILTDEKFTKQYFENAISVHQNFQSIANWITTELFGRLNKEGLDISKSPISPENLAELVKLIDEDVISGKIAKNVFDEMFQTSRSPESIIESKGLKQITNSSEIKTICEQVINSNSSQVEAYKAGKEGLFGFFVGQVMKLTSGKANPGVVNSLLKDLLKK